MKKIISLGFTLLVSAILFSVQFSTFAGAASTGSLFDIEGNQYETAIRYLADENIVSGYPDGSFKPDRNVNRAEFVKILIGSILSGVVPNIPSGNCFPDVPKNEWFAPYICYAKTNQIINGYDDGTFKPAGEINLAEATKIIVNSMSLAIDSDIPDEPWYRKFIETMQSGKYLPSSFTKLDQKVNRSQMAEMIWRIMEGKNDQPSAEFTFGDVDSSNGSTVSFLDDAPTAGNPNGTCSVPDEAKAMDTSNPNSVIGDGTPASCSSQKVVDAIANGGVITFNCGSEPVTIKMNDTAKIFNDKGPEIVIDGGGLITLDGQDQRRILYMSTCDQAQVWTTPNCNNQDHPRLTVQNMTFINGNSLGDANGGGAIYVQGGRLKVVNSRFFNNACSSTGQDVGGAAIRVFGQFNDLPVYVVNSTFGGAEEYGNTCSNGAGLSGLWTSYTVINSLFSNNSATGNGANPAQANTPGGGSGAAIYADGNDFNLNICGTAIHDNVANEGGGAIFFVSNDSSGNLIIKDSELKRNQSKGFETDGYPGIFYIGEGNPQVTSSVIE